MGRPPSGALHRSLVSSCRAGHKEANAPHKATWASQAPSVHPVRLKDVTQPLRTLVHAASTPSRARWDHAWCARNTLVCDVLASQSYQAGAPLRPDGCALQHIALYLYFLVPLWPCPIQCPKTPFLIPLSNKPSHVHHKLPRFFSASIRHRAMPSSESVRTFCRFND